jgi:hypothetical protein
MLSKILQPLSQEKFNFKILTSVKYENLFVIKLNKFPQKIVIFLIQNFC